MWWRLRNISKQALNFDPDLTVQGGGRWESGDDGKVASCLLFKP
jgi:hypothetical protein